MTNLPSVKEELVNLLDDFLEQNYVETDKTIFTEEIAEKLLPLITRQCREALKDVLLNCKADAPNDHFISYNKVKDRLANLKEESK